MATTSIAVGVPRARLKRLASVRIDRALAYELILLSGLVVAAGAIRLREFATAPSWTDEVREIVIALDIATGQALPLTNIHAYIGAIWNYVLAAAFLTVGPYPDLPRLVALTFGLGTIIATYLLGRRLGGPVTGGIAAGLLVVSGTHVLVNSRIAWSHSITPLFTTLTIWLLLGATAGGRRLVFAGLTCGLAVQTHITATALVPAVGAFVLGWRRSWLRSRWVWLGGLAFLGANTNVLLFHLLNGPQVMFAHAAKAYGKGPGQELVSRFVGGDTQAELFVANAGRLALTSVRILSGAVDIRPTVTAYLSDPLIIASVVLLLVGLVQVTRRVSVLPLLVLIAWGLLLIFVVKKSEVIPNARFLMPAIPLSLALVSCGITQCARLLTRRALIRGAIVVTLTGALAFASLAGLEARLGDLKDSSQTSAGLARMVDIVASTRGPSEPVFVDPLLVRLWLDGGGTVNMALKYRFRVVGVPMVDLRERNERPPDDRFEIDTCGTNRIVLQQVRIGDGDPLERLLPGRSVPPVGTAVWLVRVADPKETPSGSTLVIRHQPPIMASGRAMFACGRDRLI